MADIATWGSGGTPKRSEPSYFGTGVPWLSISDLNDGPVRAAKESLTSAGVENCAAKVVPAGTVLVAMYGSIGKLGVAESELCTSQAIAFAIPNIERIDPRYLFHFLLAERPKLIARGRGGTQMNIGQGDLKSWPIPLPPLQEQRRIADILDRADALRAKRRKALALLDDLIGSSFVTMFGASRQDAWPRVAFGDLIESTKLGLVRSSDEFGPVYAIPYVRMNSITPLGELEFSTVQRTTASEDERRDYALRSGDILFNTRNSRELVGKSALVRDPPPAVFNNNLMRIRVTSEVVPSYVSRFLLSPLGVRELDRLKSGTTSVFAIYFKDLRSLPIPVPPIEMQRRFDRIESKVVAQKARISPGLSSLDRLFESLQQQAFAGQL